MDTLKLLQVLNKQKSLAKEPGINYIYALGMLQVIQAISSALKEDSEAELLPNPQTPQKDTYMSSLCQSDLTETAQFSNQRHFSTAASQTYASTGAAKYPDTLPDATGFSSEPEESQRSESQEAFLHPELEGLEEALAGRPSKVKS